MSKEADSGWVRMRELGVSTPQQAEHGSVSWHPGGIYNAKSLMINVDDLNKVLSLMKMRAPLAILQKENRTEAGIESGSVSPSGETAASGKSFKKSTKEKDIVSVYWDSLANKNSINMDFKYLYEASVDASSSKEDVQRYAKNVDILFKRTLPRLAFINTFNSKNLSEGELVAVVADSVKTVVGSAPFLLMMTLSGARSLSQNATSEEMLALFYAWAGISTVFNLQVSLILSSSNRYKSDSRSYADGYKNYLRGNDLNKIKRLLSTIQKASTPYFIIENLLIPAIIASSWRKPFFKASDVKSK